AQGGHYRQDWPFDEKIRDTQLLVLRVRRAFVAGLSLVVDEYCRAIPQLEDSRTDDLLTWLDAGDDRNLIAARSSEFDELLPHASIALAFRVRQVRNDEHRIAIR